MRRQRGLFISGAVLYYPSVSPLPVALNLLLHFSSKEETPKTQCCRYILRVRVAKLVRSVISPDLDQCN